MRRSRSSLAANPVLVGAATTLVVLVAVFLAYNANNGLPFVPTYDVRALVPNAQNLVRGNEVRVGGTRVGVVTGVRARRLPGGRAVAQLDLQLDKTVEPLPVDTTVLVRPRSALGLKYLELTPGRMRQSYGAGETIPLTRARPATVELDEVLNAFDDRTRAATRTNLHEFGNALAARGAALNRALEELPGLLADLRPVMADLADPATGLGRFVRVLSRTAAQVAPVAEQQGRLVAGLDTTLTALAGVARPYLQDAISATPPLLERATRELPRQRSFLANATALFAELGPGARALRRGAGDLAVAVERGEPVLRRSLAFNARLEPALRALRRFAQDPRVALGLRGLATTATLARVPVAEITPSQTVCSYLTLFLRNAASVLSPSAPTGTGQRFILIATPQGPDSEGGPAGAPASGPNDNRLHANPYPHTAAPGEPRECEAGNEAFLAGRTVLGNVPGNQGVNTEATQ